MKNTKGNVYKILRVYRKNGQVIVKNYISIYPEYERPLVVIYKPKKGNVKYFPVILSNESLSKFNNNEKVHIYAGSILPVHGREDRIALYERSIDEITTDKFALVLFRTPINVLKYEGVIFSTYNSHALVLMSDEDEIEDNDYIYYFDGKTIKWRER